MRLCEGGAGPEDCREQQEFTGDTLTLTNINRWEDMVDANTTEVLQVPVWGLPLHSDRLRAAQCEQAGPALCGLPAHALDHPPAGTVHCTAAAG